MLYPNGSLELYMQKVQIAFVLCCTNPMLPRSQTDTQDHLGIIACTCLWLHCSLFCNHIPWKGHSGKHLKASHNLHLCLKPKSMEMPFLCILVGQQRTWEQSQTNRKQTVSSSPPAHALHFSNSWKNHLSTASAMTPTMGLSQHKVPVKRFKHNILIRIVSLKRTRAL